MSLRLYILILLMVAAANVHASPKNVRVCLMDSTLYPLWRSPGDEGSVNPGINIELHQRIASTLNFTIVWVRAPFPRCLVMLKENKVDMLNVASYSADRERYGLYPKVDNTIDYSRRLKTEGYHAYAMKDSHIEWDGEQFHNTAETPIAIEIGASIRGLLNEMNLPVYEVSGVQHAFGMLRKGRVSAVVTSRFNGLIHGGKEVVELAPSLQGRAYFIMVAEQFYQRYPALTERVWDESARARENEYDVLLKAYIDVPAW